MNDVAALERLMNPLHAPPRVCIQFKATWCGPCKRIQRDRLLAATPGVTWYEVDADEGADIMDYCGVTMIPAFLAIQQGVPQPLFQSSDTTQIVEWLQSVWRH